MVQLPIAEEIREIKTQIEVTQYTIARKVKETHESMDELEQLRRDLKLVEDYQDGHQA